jgi:hypothetical protein
MAVMFEPDIVFHYYGRLRDALMDAACPTLVPTLRSDCGPRVVLVPTTSVDAVKALVRRAELGRYLDCRSGTAESLEHYLKVSADQVVWLPQNGTKDLVDECRFLERVARGRGQSVQVLPVPGLAAREVLRLVDVAPSTLLAGSHPLERRLSEYLAALPEPLGPLVSAAWRELQSTTDLSLLSRAAFEERLAQLHPSVVKARLWSAVVELWRVILRGMDEERARAQVWIRGIESRSDGHVGLSELNDMGRYEQAIFASHALKDPCCLSYAAVVHGHRWVLGRYSLAFFSASFGLPSSGYGSSIFEAG